MSFEQLIAILRARWVIALSTFVLIAGSVAAFTLLMPKSYTASGSVLVDIKSPDPIAGMVSAAVAQPSFLMTQIDILTSSRVALKVVKATKLSESGAMRDRWQKATNGVGNFDQWMADLLRKSLDARPSRGSNVIYLTYSSPEPNFASAIVNAFIQAYLETSIELRNSPAKQFNDLFDVNAKQLRTRLEEAQDKLSAYQQKQGLIVNDERLDVESARLSELSTQLVSMQAMLADSGSRQAAAQNQADRSPDIIANPLVSSLKGDVVRQEGQLEQLSARYGEQHPLVIEAKSSLNDLRRKLEIETRRVASSVGVNNTVNASRVAQVKAALDEQRAKVLKMKTLRDEASLLQRDVDNAQRAFEGVAMRMNASKLESQAQQASVAALEMSLPPSVPSSPRVVSNIALGMVVATLAAIGLALVMEFRDRRLRTLGEVEPLIQQALIGVIPSFKKHSPDADLPKRMSLGVPRIKALTHKA